MVSLWHPLDEGAARLVGFVPCCSAPSCCGVVARGVGHPARIPNHALAGLAGTSRALGRGSTHGSVCGMLLREAGGRLRPHSHPGISRHVLGALFGMNHPWRAPTAAVGLSPSATAQGGIPCASTARIHEQTLSHACWHLLAPRAGQGVGQEPGREGDDHQLMIHVSSVSPSSTGHQADLRQLQQPRHLAPGAEAPGGSRAPRRDSGTGRGGGSRGTRSCGGCRAELPGGKTPSTAAKNP